MKFELHFFLVAIALTVVMGCDSPSKTAMMYIDPVQPRLQPQLFAKDFITKDSISEFGSVFNSAGDEFYFAIDSVGRSLIKYSKMTRDGWTDPIAIFSDDKYSFNDPFLSPDETKLYFISDLPRNLLDTMEDIDIWYSDRVDDRWSEPINAGPVINSDANEYYISFTSDGSMYYASNTAADDGRDHDFDIYKSQYFNEKYQTPVRLSDSINTRRYEADVFIAPDESYIIYSTGRRDGYGSGDLYISFKREDGEWTKSVNMGIEINSKSNDLCPFVTSDGKFFFYTSNQDIYWVSTDIFENLRH